MTELAQQHPVPAFLNGLLSGSLGLAITRCPKPSSTAPLHCTAAMRVDAALTLLTTSLTL